MAERGREVRHVLLVQQRMHLRAAGASELSDTRREHEERGLHMRPAPRQAVALARTGPWTQPWPAPRALGT